MNIDPSSLYKEDINIDNHCMHLHDDFKSNSKKKYSRHFGNEQNCPICVAIQMKNKLLEEKNRMLPVLTNNVKKTVDAEKNKSPNKDKMMKTIYPKNKEKKIIRIGSGTSILSMRNIHKRKNESVKQLRRIEIANNFQNEKKIDKDIFPIIRDYFNEK